MTAVALSDAKSGRPRRVIGVAPFAGWPEIEALARRLARNDRIALAVALACGDRATLASYLMRRPAPPEAVLDAIADFLADSSAHAQQKRRTRLMHLFIAGEVEAIFAKRVSARERKHGLRKKVIGEVADRRKVKDRTVRDALNEKLRLYRAVCCDLEGCESTFGAVPKPKPRRSETLEAYRARLQAWLLPQLPSPGEVGE